MESQKELVLFKRLFNLALSSEVEQFWGPMFLTAVNLKLCLKRCETGGGRIKFKVHPKIFGQKRGGRWKLELIIM